MRRRAFENLVAAGTNALLDAGMPLRFDDVSEEQKQSATETKEEGVHSLFKIDGVESCAVSVPCGFGEERIVVLYDSTDLGVARDAVQGAFYLKS